MKRSVRKSIVFLSSMAMVTSFAIFKTAKKAAGAAQIKDELETNKR